MKELFEHRTLQGAINKNLKYKDANSKVVKIVKWSCEKSQLCGSLIKIVEKYESEGYKLTLRQLYYQLVGKALIPNHDDVYKKIGKVVDDMKYSGLINWDSMEDRGRVPMIPYTVNNVKHALQDAADTYRLPRQRGQEPYIELWTEKDAISEILYRVTALYGIRLVVNKGYTSSTAIYRSYERFVEALNEGRPVTLFYFGDHDPSGLDMIRDIEDRVKTMLLKGDQFNEAMAINHAFYKGWHDEKPEVFQNDKYYIEGDNGEEFSERHAYIGEMFHVKPIGLTMDQIKQYALPPNPAKITDPRAKSYIKQYGSVSWEVDALEPSTLSTLIHDAITKEINTDIFDEVMDEEKNGRKILKKYAKDF